MAEKVQVDSEMFFKPTWKIKYDVQNGTYGCGDCRTFWAGTDAYNKFMQHECEPHGQTEALPQSEML